MSDAALQTRLLAWSDLNYSGSIGRRQSQVLDLFRSANVSFSNEDISNMLNLPINCVTGRVFELRKRCLLIFSGHKTSKSGKKICKWRRM